MGLNDAGPGTVGGAVEQSTGHSSGPSPRTIPALLRAAAHEYADQCAYVGEDGTRLSYADLLDQVRDTARGYLALGLEPGDRVCLWGPNTTSWAVAALAVTYAGGVLVPANSRYTGHEVADLVIRTRARLVLVHDGFLGRTQLDDLDSAAEMPDLSASLDISEGLDLLVHAGADVDAAAVEARADAVGPDDVADILFTSGTTGRSKGALSAHRQTVGVARVWGELAGVHDGDRYLVVNPFFHSFGYKVGMITGLATGATLYPVAAFDVAATLRLIEDEQITVLPGAPTIFTSLLAAPGRAEADLTSLRVAVTGAAVVPVVLIERMRAPAPEGLGIATVVTAFGMTEAVVATMCRPGDSAETVANTCGRPIDGIEARIGDEGELLLRGEFVTLGYLDDPEATREAIDSEGWLHTGDVGTLDDQGNLRITDRLKDMYISGGFNVYPAEIEQTLARLDGVADVAVVGIPDERMGEVGRAYVVRSGEPRTSEGLTAETVIGFARERLANYKVPREVEFIDVLPRNLGGKVLKNELRAASTHESQED